MPPSENTLARRLQGVEQIAVDLLRSHGLTDWTFGYNRRKRSLGVCFYTRRRIELSVHLVERNGPDEVLDTLLHELAHAIVGPGHNHDAVWKAKCREVGAKPERCGAAAMPEGKWQGTCGVCGRTFRRHRRPRRVGYYCPRCGPGNGTLTWVFGA